MNVGLIFDLAAGCLLAFFLARGLIKGFSGEIIGLVGLMASTFCALSFMNPAADLIIKHLPQFSENQHVIAVICASVIFLGVSLGFSLLNKILSYIVKAAKLSFLDHALGLVTGALKTVCIILFIYGIFTVFSPTLPTDWLKESYTMRGAEIIFPYARDFLEKYGIIDLEALSKK